jgi:hypothetical protein
MSIYESGDERFGLRDQPVRHTGGDHGVDRGPLDERLAATPGSVALNTHVSSSPMSLLDIAGFLPILLAYAVGVMILYWTIRLAVRHAIRDADERRSRTNQ